MGRRCAECGSEHITREEIDRKFPYRAGEEEVILNCKIPIYVCESCGYSWYNHEAEEIMDEYIEDYLEKNKK